LGLDKGVVDVGNGPAAGCENAVSETYDRGELRRRGRKGREKGKAEKGRKVDNEQVKDGGPAQIERALFEHLGEELGVLVHLVLNVDLLVRVAREGTRLSVCILLSGRHIRSRIRR
jgi:hypothetical protein